MTASDSSARLARRWPVRLGLALVVTVYLVYSSFGVAHPVLWGHYGHHTAEYILRARTSLRFHMISPATSYGFETPRWYYFHHPIGYHHVYTLLLPILGDHEWVAAAVPAATGLLVLWALYAVARRWWSREAGLLAVAVYVGLPILCSFSILTDAMLPAMACSIATVYAFNRYIESPSRRWLVAGCAAIAVGGLLMWEAYFQTVFHAIGACIWALTRHGKASRLGRWRAALPWIFFTGLVAATVMGLHFLFVWRQHMWADFLFSYHLRHTATAQYVIDAHRRWLEILYGWPPVVLGLVWWSVFGARALVGRARLRDQAVAIFCLINVLYIYLFKEGSSLHLYRVFWFSSFFALAATDLVVDGHAACRWALGRWPRAGRWVATGAAGIAITAYFVVEAPHAYANLLESRVMMGTHGLPGYNADYAKQLFAMEVARATGPEDYVFIHNSIPHRIEFYYYVDRSTMDISSLGELAARRKAHPRAVLLVDKNLPLGERKLLYDLLARHPAYAYDRYVMIDLRSTEPGLHEYAFVPRKPSWAWRWFVSHKYPPMSRRDAPSLLAACAYANAKRAPAPSAAEPAPPPPSQLAEAVCYHNYQVVRGRGDVAAKYHPRTPAPPHPHEVPFGSVGKVVALSNPARGGTAIWMLVDRPPSRDRWLRWRLEPLATSQPTLAGEIRPTADLPLAETRAGYLYVERVPWSVRPGKYRLIWELGLPTPPPPPRRLPSAKAPPLAPATPPPEVRADLGVFEIK